MEKPGVPPVMVLDVMFPELTQKEMETLDVTQFTQLVDGRQAALEERQMNLNITAMSRTTTTTTTTTTTVSTTSTTTVAEGSGGSDGSGDSDGSGVSDGSGDSDSSVDSDGSGGTDGSGETDTDNTEAESGGNRRKRFAPHHHRRARRQISFNEMYDGMLVPENEVKGIQPKGGDLKNAEVCPCGPPASKLRKEIKLKVAWENDMWDPNSDNFQRIKAEVEEKVRMYHTF